MDVAKLEKTGIKIRSCWSLFRISLFLFLASVLVACGNGGGGGGGGNAAPTINSTAVTAATEDAAYSYTFTATDANAGDTLTLSAPTLPAWLSFVAGTGVLSGTPVNADVGDHNVTLRVNDGTVDVDQAFVITVANTNDAPVITSSATPSVAENTTAVITVTATDADVGDTPTFSITGLTADDTLFSIDTNSGVLTFLAAPDFDAPADIGTDNVYDIEVTADDGNGGTDVQTIAVTVTGVNEAPTITSTEVTAVDEDAAYSYTFTATDVDAGDTLTLSAPTLPAWLNFVAGTGVLSGTPVNADVGDHNVTLRVNDGTVDVDQVFVITVANTSDDAVAADDSATLIEDQTINIDLVANDADVDIGDAIDPTSIVIISQPGNMTATLTANPDGTVDYTHDGSPTTSDSFTYTVMSDDGSTSNTAAVNITVLQRFNEGLYSRPTTSSNSSAVRQFEATDGLSGDSTNGWVAASTTPDTEWIKMTFDSTKSIYRVTVADLVDTTDDVETVTIDFSNGDQITAVTLPDDGTLVEGTNDLVFAPKQVDWIKVTLNTVGAGSAFIGLSEFGAFSVLDPGQKSLKRDRFNDGDVSNWTEVDDCDKGAPAWSLVDNVYTQTGDCRGFSVNEGVELGTYAILDGLLTAGSGFEIKDMDLRLKLKSGGGAPTGYVNGAVGVVFAYRSTNDYYRLDFSQAEGHIKLWKQVGGLKLTELATSPQSYATDTWVNLRIVRQNGVIVVYKDDVKIMAVEDNTGPLNNNDYRIGLLCARNESCSFDTLNVLSPPIDPFSGVPSNPIVGANIDDDGFCCGEHTSGEYYVDTAGSLDITAVVTDDTNITGIEFEVDGDTGSAQIDAVAPYTATFGSLTQGEHTVRVFLRDGGGRLSGAAAMAELPQVGVSGIHLVGLGDSITGGLRDTDTSDDVSADGRNTNGGYQPVLNNLLTADNGGKPVTVLDEGNPGETSAEGAVRMAAMLERTPAAQGYLAIYGANDSGLSTPSGLGLYSGDGGYVGSFKDNMQQMIDAAVGAGKAIYLAKTLPHTGDVVRDALLQQYNLVIDELVTDNGFGYTPPDFHTYFTAESGTEMFDTLHPNGLGYKTMAEMWCTALNGQAGIVCTP